MFNGKRGFTLIELLVVIAIIAILAAILFPVFGRAKQTAVAMSCLSNLKQLGIAVDGYLNDNGGKYPMVDYMRAKQQSVKDPNGWVYNGQIGVGWDDAKKTYTLNGQITYVNKYSIRAVFQRYIRNNAIWKCPADAYCDINVNLGKRWTSYPFRPYITGGTLPYNAWFKDKGYAPFSVSKFPHPTRTFFFCEITPFHTQGGSYVGQQNYAESMKDGSQMLNFAFMDGHVGRYAMHRVLHWVVGSSCWDYGWPHWDGQFIDFGCKNPGCQLPPK